MRHAASTLALCSLLVIIGISPAHAVWVPDGIVVAPYTDPAPSQPQVTWDASGGTIVAWQDTRGGSSDIYVQRVNSSGTVLWTTDGVAICVAAGDQTNPKIVSDLSGGAIITWQDNRGGNYDIYAQRVNASGVAQWTSNGVAICVAGYNQINPQITWGSGGGAIIIWQDDSSGSYDIYAQRVNASGAVQWTANGVALCTAANNQGYPRVIADGSGGAIVTWQDYRSGSTYDIYTQRVNASGAVQWTANGVALCTSANDQKYPDIVSDGSGGAIVTWQDYLSGSTYDIYAGRVSSSGTVQWMVAVCTAANNQESPRITSDGGTGGAIIAWQDYRSGTTWDIYAQRVSAGATMQWTANGVAICTAANNQKDLQITSAYAGEAVITWQDSRYVDAIYAQKVGGAGVVQWTPDGVALTAWLYGNQLTPQITIDGWGGAIITWEDDRALTNIYSQRVSNSGTVSWMANGVGICTAPDAQLYPETTSDGSGGAIIAWMDGRSGDFGDIYAQRVDAVGAALWAASGVALCADPGDQEYPALISDGSGGAIVAWQDGRNGTSVEIYAQRVNTSGTVQWTADGVAICTVANQQDNLPPALTSDGAGGAIIAWMDYRGGNFDIYAQRVNASGTPLWTTNGVAICTAAYAQAYPQIISDGAGGAIITWQDARNGTSVDIYAQRVNASGTVQWTTGGVALCAASYNQLHPQITPDGSDGAIVTWVDYRGGSGQHCYAQRVNASGVVQWTTDGVGICTDVLHVVDYPQITSDGAGGAIIAWQDIRSSNYGIYAQRVNVAGAVLWTADGIPLTTAASSNPAREVRIVQDGSGGAIVSWQDAHTGISYDVYAQRVDASGTVLWGAEGAPICTTDDAQEAPRLSSDGAGGAIITWMDYRGLYRIYAQRTTEYGLGPICSVEPTEIDMPGTVIVGSSRDTSFTITNEGVGGLMGGATVVSDQFQIVSGGGSFLLSSGQSRVVTVRFEPTAPGSHSCMIETGAYICSDVSITGTATELPPDSVIYVDADATGEDCGSSWANAFTDLQDALALAPSCPGVTQIWVAEGTYRPTTGTDRDATFELLNNLAIYGGFAGTETQRSQRNVHAHVTTLSGDIGTLGDASDNSYHVILVFGNDTTAVLDGFTVTGGKADGSAWEETVGGGLYNFTGSPTLANIEFRANAAQGYGGGIYNENGTPKMINAIFRQNSAIGKGGGMYSYGVYGHPKLINMVLIGNVSGETGGGIYSEGSLSLVNASFFGNSAAGAGGAMCNFSGSSVIANTIMWGDSSAWCGEASQNCSEIFNYPGVTPTISYSLIQRSGGSAGWDPSLGTDGGHNIDADPLYYGAEAGDLRILVGSPAIDAGNSAVPGLPATDIAGNPRIQNGTVDMGAYEGGVAALYSYARMDSLVDVPHDQGGWLRIYFTRSSYDDPLEEEYPIARYDIHRRVDDLGLLASINSAGEVIRENLIVKLLSGEKVSLTAPSSDAGSKYVRYADRYYLVNEAGAAASAPAGTWEVVGNVSAEQQAHYIRLAPTLADSSATLVWSVYYISAHTTTPTVHFDSPPDSAYSVDNIAPGVPESFVVAYNTGSGNHLTWDPSTDSDFQYFKVYRGTDPDFVPAPSNMVHATAGTEWSDPEYDVGGIYYKITALDHAGNESDPASPESTTGVDDHSVPRAFALYQNVPNPFNPATTIRFDLPVRSSVRLAVYNIKGQLVRILLDEQTEAGRKEIMWDGRDSIGRGVASGIYFYRLQTPGISESRKMILLK